MIAGLDRLGLDAPGPAAAQLRRLLGSLVASPGDGAALVEAVRLSRRVHRVRFQVAGRPRSLVVKRLAPDVARRGRLVADRWLPAVGLDELRPVLLGVAADPDGNAVWHVYEDLGDRTLEAEGAGPGDRDEAVRALARLHVACAGHALQGEFRLWGADLGSRFVAGSVGDAIVALQAWAPPAVEPGAQLRQLRDRLLTRLDRLVAELPARVAELAETALPETLLHGDPWPRNFVMDRRRARVHLVDWDHAGLGPITYDLSTLLARVPAAHRLRLLEAYRRTVAPAGWQLPDARRLNRLFETAELGRISNRLIWPAIAVLDGDVARGGAALAEIATWFAALRPLLPDERPA